MKTTDLCNQLLKKFGYMNQIYKLLEEVMELIEAIKSGDKNAVCEELADVCFLCEQILLSVKYEVMRVFNISQEEFIAALEYKQNRTINRYLKGEQHENI